MSEPGVRCSEFLPGAWAPSPALASAQLLPCSVGLLPESEESRLRLVGVVVGRVLEGQYDFFLIPYDDTRGGHTSGFRERHRGV